ncbi:hypothetical protein BX070DRAFT_100466 [Coemansia spiralis]|nr:hypothetical protein BX070DRAFT_100466 [Coemansia spiralis]
MRAYGWLPRKRKQSNSVFLSTLFPFSTALVKGGEKGGTRRAHLGAAVYISLAAPPNDSKPAEYFSLLPSPLQNTFFCSFATDCDISQQSSLTSTISCHYLCHTILYLVLSVHKPS